MASASAQLSPGPTEVHHIHGLALDRRDPEVPYVATHTGLVRLRPNGAPEWVGSPFDLSLTASPDAAGRLLAGTKAGLFASRDRGATWARVETIPAAPVAAVTYHETDGRVVYLYVAQPGRGLWRSRDAGDTWEPVGAVVPTGSVAVALVAGPGDHVVVATSKSDIFRSRDGGRTWKAVLEQGRPVSRGP